MARRKAKTTDQPNERKLLINRGYEKERDRWKRTVQFGARPGISITCEIKTDPQDDLNELRDRLCDSILDVVLVADPNGQQDVAGQKALIDGRIRIEAVAESKNLILKGKRLVMRLNFARSDIQIEELDRLANCVGSISLKRLGAISKDASGIEIRR